MKIKRNGYVLGVKEHLLRGQPITRLEALTLYGVASLTSAISQMRKEGWVILSRKIVFAAAVVRVNEHAVLTPPPNLPIREIQLTEYWLSK